MTHKTHITIDKSANIITYGQAKCPDGIHPLRWAGILKCFKKYRPELFPQTIRVELYGGGHRWCCQACHSYHNGQRRMYSFTNSTPPQHCPTCGGVQIGV